MTTDANFESFVSSLEKQFVPSEEMAAHAIYTIRASLKEYVASRNLRSLVVGLYGDLDSSVVAAICQEEFTGVPLLGVIIPDMDNEERRASANWAGEAFCNAYHEEGTPHTTYQINDVFDSYIDVSTDWDFNESVHFIIFQYIARRTNGMVVGSKTWSDLFATFLYQEGEADYFPLKSVNKGFELPVFAKMLEIPEDIIEDPAESEEIIGATYREVDAIINGHLGNLDDNLSTQLNRYTGLEKIQRVLLRFTLNEYITTLPSREIRTLQDRNALGLPTKYSY